MSVRVSLGARTTYTGRGGARTDKDMIRYVRQKLGLLLINIIRMRHGVVIFYGERERARILDTIARVRRERKLLLSDHEAYQLFMIVQKVAHVEADIAEPIKNKKFSLVHFDVDTYESTKNSIEFFYPRMTRGGVILSHDYINS